MVRIRLVRRGAKKAPFYRVVVADIGSPRNGRFIENLGYYNPTKNPQIIELNKERVIYWLGAGAQPSDTARSLFRKEGILKELHGAGSGSAPEAEAETSESEEA